MTYQDLVFEFAPWGVGKYAIQSALESRGYSRFLSRAIPPLPETIIKIRCEWAPRHIYFGYEDWKNVIWSDETWMTDGRHREVYVSRRPGDELEQTCIVDKTHRKTAWIFWGSFYGGEKEPCLFWEKSWGSITSSTHCEYKVPLVVSQIEGNPLLHFMPDNAPPHQAAATREVLRYRNRLPLDWPAYSPDLNPIESVWSEIKDLI